MTITAVLVGLSIISMVGDVCMKYAAQGSSVQMGWFGLSIVVYMSAYPGWLYVMRRAPLSHVGALWSACSVVVLVGAGLVLFRETLTLRSAAGIACAIATIWLMS